MNSFSFGLPQHIVFGTGSLAELPGLVRKLDSEHAFLISDHGLEQVGTVGQVYELLEQAGIEVEEFLDVLPNPTVEIVEAAVAAYQASGASCIVALGGGSPMDVAKAVGVIVKFGGGITEYEGADKVPGAIEPVIAIPTTAGTGSEVTPFSVITDEARNHKLSVFSSAILPAHALLDPDLITAVPAGVAAACGLDAMIHAWEAYTSRGATPFTDAMAEKALELVGEYLRRYVANRSDIEAAEGMMIASTFAGIAFGSARCGNIHAMSHPISAFFHVAHGVANSILLPTIVEFNALADHGRYERIYRCIRQDKKTPVTSFCPQMLVDEARRLTADLGIPATLSEVGVTEDKIEAMAKDAMTSGNIAVNPRQTTIEDVIALYHKAL